MFKPTCGTGQDRTTSRKYRAPPTVSNLVFCMRKTCRLRRPSRRLVSGEGYAALQQNSPPPPGRAALPPSSFPTPSSPAHARACVCRAARGACKGCPIRPGHADLCLWARVDWGKGTQQATGCRLQATAWHLADVETALHQAAMQRAWAPAHGCIHMHVQLSC